MTKTKRRLHRLQLVIEADAHLPDESLRGIQSAVTAAAGQACKHASQAYPSRVVGYTLEEMRPITPELVSACREFNVAISQAKTIDDAGHMSMKASRVGPALTAAMEVVALIADEMGAS